MNREGRREFSENRLGELRAGLANSRAAKVEGLAMYTTGSLGRLEASENSDLDLFFMFDGGKVDGNSKATVPRLNKVRIDAELINIAETLKYPPFSGDGRFLDIHYFSEIVKVLGSDRDDSTNAFTARMLLLLESRPICGTNAYQSLLRKNVDLYFRDFPEHADDFRPLFLVNDICRFWRTLCLNYEHQRKRAPADEKPKAAIKNLKLKFSRLVTCFGTILALSQKRDTITVDDVLELAGRTPLERLVQGASTIAEAQPILKRVVASYEWFLETTDRAKQDLIKWIEEDSNKREALAKAKEFGDDVYELLKAVADKPTLRNLVL